MTIKVLIADDQPLVRAGVTQLIGNQPATGRTRWSTATRPAWSVPVTASFLDSPAERQARPDARAPVIACTHAMVWPLSSSLQATGQVDSLAMTVCEGPCTNTPCPLIPLPW